MSIISGIAIYFVIWWTVLFVVLPFGVRSQYEAGATYAEGTDPGAPVQAHIKGKLIITTLAAGIVFAIFYVVKTRWWI